MKPAFFGNPRFRCNLDLACRVDAHENNGKGGIVANPEGIREKRRWRRRSRSREFELRFE
jgi:hypothetical protein